MLEKAHRFQGPNSSRHVQRRGESVRSGPFSLRYVKRTEPGSRWAVVVSKKVDKRAVARNRIRRRVFEALRHDLQATNLQIDATIGVFDASVATVPHKELVSDLQKLLSQVKVNN